MATLTSSLAHGLLGPRRPGHFFTPEFSTNNPPFDPRPAKKRKECRSSDECAGGYISRAIRTDTSHSSLYFRYQ